MCAGRVFSARQLIAWAVIPSAPLIPGPLADFAFEPAMRADGAPAPLFGWLTGAGPGAGMALIIIVAGGLAACAGVAGYLVPVVRRAEAMLADHEVQT